MVKQGNRKPARNYIEELGLERTNKLDEATCLVRVRRLKRGIRHGYWADDQDLFDHAKYYKRWYQWCADRIAAGKSYRGEA